MNESAFSNTKAPANRKNVIRRLILVLTVLILCTSASLVSCVPGNGPNGDPGPDNSVIDAKEMKTMDIYENGYNNYFIVGFDEQGRTVGAASAAREKREVGIFYFAWLGQPYANDIYDVSKIIAEHGQDVVFHEEGGDISPNGQAHWWAEPLYGYYNSNDKWVIRKHMELLTAAGVDFLIFDTTNCLIYEEVVKNVMRTSQELHDEGWKAPKVAFYTHSRSIQTIGNIYKEFYKLGRYPDSWYCIDGKPMIIGYTSAALDKKEAKSRGDDGYDPEDLSPELQEFFYIKEACWPNDFHNENSFPYTEWCYPQPMNGNTMNVSVATHPMVPFSFSLTHENWCNWGRGYDVVTGENRHEDIYRGTFFQSEWETVHNSDPQPEIVMVTGWNEWIAYKSPYGGEYMLCDNVDMEYSRDIEPMQGGYEDAYYIQMIENIRRYKYESAEDIIAENVSKTVDIAGGSNQWNDVKAVYRRTGTDNEKRASYGGAMTVKYKTPAADNNVLTVKVTNDSDYLYFRIECDAPVNVTGKASWMNLFIGKGNPSVKGWESYEYAAGRVRDDMNAPSGKAAVEKLSADFSGEKVAEAEYCVSDSAVVWKVPISALGFEIDEGGDGAGSGSGPDVVYKIYFKVADGVENPAEIMDYYSTGRSLPMGRLSYEYKFRR